MAYATLHIPGLDLSSRVTVLQPESALGLHFIELVRRKDLDSGAHKWRSSFARTSKDYNSPMAEVNRHLHAGILTRRITKLGRPNAVPPNKTVNNPRTALVRGAIAFNFLGAVADATRVREIIVCVDNVVSDKLWPVVAHVEDLSVLDRMATLPQSFFSGPGGNLPCFLTDPRSPHANPQPLELKLTWNS